jgi:hypothetical protein
MPTRKYLPVIMDVIREQRQRAQIDAARHRIAERERDRQPDPPDQEEDPIDADEHDEPDYDPAA